jgi:hypothetical protein
MALQAAVLGQPSSLYWYGLSIGLAEAVLKMRGLHRCVTRTSMPAPHLKKSECQLYRDLDE